MKRCGLLGKNIQYSKSPDIHNQYYQSKELPISYEIFDIEEKDIALFIRNLKQMDIIGFNITIPYKETILKFVDKLEYPAKEINAVNTVSVEECGLVGYNTDYYGFIKSLDGYNLSGSNALVLGSGGSAKCVAYALKDLNCSTVSIYTRNKHKAINEFGLGCNIIEAGEDIFLGNYDIIVNCTPLGGPNNIDSIPIQLKGIKKGCIVYDLNYVPKKTKLLEEAEKQGAVIINGECMLINQAHRAADIWIKNTFL
jgi:shikimate dehydrogenase